MASEVLDIKVSSTAYKQLHIWMNRTHPRIGRCEFCGTERKTCYAIGARGYTRDRADWFELCYPCHTRLDGRQNARPQRGVANGRAKLCEDDVREIRALYAAGGWSQPQLARRFGVTHPLIGKIVRRELWKEVVPVG
jgi:ribosome-binding protein aMBF1 (putative translation factor)